MNIIFIAQQAFSSVGGIQRFNVRFIHALAELASDETDFDVQVLVRSDSNSDIPPKIKGISLQAFSGSAFFFACRTVFLALQTNLFILGHINFLPLAAICKIFNPSASIYMVAHGIEVWGANEFRKYRWWEPYLLKWSVTKIISVSDFTANKLVENTGFTREKITIFPNVIDIDDARDHEFISNKRNGVILTVTRLGEGERKKNVHIVISAVAELNEKGIDSELHIAGDGFLLNELQALSTELGIESKVFFHGRVSDTKLHDLYNSASIFVLPSEKEGFGIVYLEAWKNGLPVIAAKATAIPEVIDDGIDGLLIHPVDSITLCNAIAKIISNPLLGNEMARMGRQKLVEKFNHAAFVNRLRTIVSD